MVMPSQIYIWDVRWTLPTNEDKPEYEERFRALLKKETKHWAFQLERGHQAELLHFQARVSLNNSASASGVLVKRWKVGTEGSAWDFSITSNANTKNFDYQLKEDTRVRGPFTDKDESERYIPRQWRMPEEKYHPWQKTIIESLEEWDQRVINVLWDPDGQQGKSTISHICRLKHRCFMLRVRGKGEEMLQDTLCQLQAKKDITPSGFFVDLTRSSNQLALKGLYDALEDIKNGWVTDWRYSYKEWDFDSPVVWVMCNKMPNPRWVSTDRWRCWQIDQDTKQLKAVPLACMYVVYGQEREQATDDL